LGRNPHDLFVEEPEGKRSLGRPRPRWADNVKVDLVKTGCDGVDCIGIAQDRDKWRAPLNAVTNLQNPQYAAKLGNSCTSRGLSSSSQLHRVGSLVNQHCLNNCNNFPK
jgi:hypothetical protein